MKPQTMALIGAAFILIGILLMAVSAWKDERQFREFLRSHHA